MGGALVIDCLMVKGKGIDGAMYLLSWLALGGGGIILVNFYPTYSVVSFVLPAKDPCL